MFRCTAMLMLLVAGACLMASCSQTGPQVATTAATAVTTAGDCDGHFICGEYQATDAVIGGQQQPWVSTSNVRVIIDDKGIVVVDTPCNTLNAYVTWEGATSTTVEIASTLQGCSQAKSDQERQLSAFMSGKIQWSRSDLMAEMQVGDDVINLRRI